MRRFGEGELRRYSAGAGETVGGIGNSARVLPIGGETGEGNGLAERCCMIGVFGVFNDDELKLFIEV